MYRTLPSSLKTRNDSGESSPSSVFGGMHLNLSNLISGGIHFFGHFRKKSPGVSNSSSSNSPSSKRSLVSSTSSEFYENEEILELRSFSSMSPLSSEDGIGHSFENISTFNPTWCDYCGVLIWGLYDTGATSCRFCNLICHQKCQKNIRLNCLQLTSSSESTLVNISEISNDESTLKDISQIQIDTAFVVNPSLPTFWSCEVPSLIFEKETLSRLIENYNRNFVFSQKTILINSRDFQGFIRVTLNLSRPINVICGTRPPSLYSILEPENSESRTEKSYTSFYLPPETIKGLHVTNTTTTRDVIKFLLFKFNVGDNPHKYALYEKYEEGQEDYRNFERETSSLRRVQMRRLRNEERPLELSILWTFERVKKILVLQENDPGEICWEDFSLPELKNFLLILDREEAWYKKAIHEKYDVILKNCVEILEEKKGNL